MDRIERVVLVISGAPRTKKNSQVHVASAGSDAWKRWKREATIRYWYDDAPRGEWWHEHLRAIPRGPYNCRALFLVDRDSADSVGLYQGLADFLERRGVIGNDRDLRTWDGCRIQQVDKTWKSPAPSFRYPQALGEVAETSGFNYELVTGPCTHVEISRIKDEAYEALLRRAAERAARRLH